ncbi:MAG: beta-galactosidase [Odoribacteraceae bacterium]|jgi:beta-galactosidase|nr:beta-galactosidase [Odoribacteraceae bacterium]
MIGKKQMFLLLFLAGTTVARVDGRSVQPFNDGWQFKQGPFAANEVKAPAFMETGWDAVTLPHTWNARDMQVQHNAYYAGESYYKKRFHADESWQGKALFLRFEGVGQVADLYVNGEFAGNHKGGYSAFAFDLSALLKYGQENELLLRVNNAARPDVIPVNHNLFGVYGGIYRPVQLIVTEAIHVDVTDHASPGIYITQQNVSEKQADIAVKVKIVNESTTQHLLTLETLIVDARGKQVARRAEPLVLSPDGTQAHVQHLRLRRPRLWHGRLDPYLYKVIVRVKTGDEIRDEVVQPLGVRHYEIRAGEGFFLNGKRYPMYGVTRHQDWWELGSALHEAQHDVDLNMIMEIGATTVRLAHYQQSDYFYSRCDTLGLIVWAEIPFVNRVTGEERENAKEQLRELIRQSFNHPSIYAWGLHNEVYKPHAYTAALTRELHDLAKSEDPDRYTAAVNGYGHMTHPVNGNADIQGMNRYFGWYEKKIKDIKPWIEELESRFPDTKFMLTEYGADANILHQTEHLGESLNWGAPFYPETFQTATHEYQWSIIAQHPYIIASYLWNTFDFAVPAWARGGVEARNMKGLVTFDRKIKKDSFYWYKANWSAAPVLYITQRRLKEREKRVTTITIYSNVGVPEVTLNGRALEGIRQGYTPVHYILDNVTLDEGKNVITARVARGEERHGDQVEWNFLREYKATGAEAQENNGEHGGF